MDWRPRLYWGGLAALVAIIAALLTGWITHVNKAEGPQLVLTFDESHTFPLERTALSLEALEEARFHIPRVIMATEGSVVFVVTPQTRSISLAGPKPRELSCGFLDSAQPGASAPYWVALTDAGPLRPIAVVPKGPGQIAIDVPEALRRSLAGLPTGQGAIKCKVRRVLASHPTFTERAMTVRGQNGPDGALLVDVSALEDVDNLRFSGGIAVPIAGERTRLLDRHDTIVSAEWSSVVAQERRDILLVIIGALAAIAAAMAIEAIRPFVEQNQR